MLDTTLLMDDDLRLYNTITPRLDRKWCTMTCLHWTLLSILCCLGLPVGFMGREKAQKSPNNGTEYLTSILTVCKKELSVIYVLYLVSFT